MSTSSYLIPLVLFMIFASPATFKAVRGVAGSWVASAEGEAKFAGLLLHAVLFVWVVGFLMRRVSRYSKTPSADDVMGEGVESGPDMSTTPIRPVLGGSPY
jgi:hypothetical protein